MIQAVDTAQVWEYICARERGDERHPADPAPTIWTLGVLDGRIMKHIKDVATGLGERDQAEAGAQTSVKLGSILWLLVKYGLRGWRHFVDPQGQPIPESFDTIAHGKQSYHAVPDAVLALMPPDVLAELANEIASHNTIQESQKRPLGS